MGIYLKSRLTRSALGYVTALLLTVFSVFGCFYSWLIESKEAERESAYSLPSEVVIASVTGTKHRGSGHYGTKPAGVHKV